MNSRRMTFLLVRTLIFFVLAVIVVAFIGWSWPGGLAVALIGLATAVQAGAVLWLRRSEGATPNGTRGAEGSR